MSAARKVSISIRVLNFTRVEGQWGIDAVAEGSGAQLAGVQRGWNLTHWNGEAYRHDLSTTCDLGEKVKLRFIDLQGQEKNLDVVCKLYPITGSPAERVSRILEGGALYLRFTGFESGTHDWLADQVARKPLGSGH